ncbi:MAG: glycosyltransferase [Acetobacteraceae bacterium]
MPQPRLSMCMIARDSARTLRAALDSIRPWVDEMVVVDTGSVDATPEIAAACGARVAHFPWCDDFAAARNESLRLASGDWLFWMDSDDTIDAANGRALRALADAAHPPALLGFVVQVQCPPADDEPEHESAVAVDHVKLLRNDPRLRFSGRIHEQILPAIRRLGGEVRWTDIAVRHSGADTSPEGRRRKQARDLHLLQLELAEHPDDSFALFNLGMTLLDAGQTEPALLQLCRSLVLSDPGESHVRKIHALLVQAYTALGRLETALKTCLAGLQAFPDDKELLFRRGVVAQRLGRLAEAEQAFRAVLAPRQRRHLSSVDVGMFGVKAWRNLAVLYDAGGRPDAAAQAWLEVLDRDADSLTAWWGLLTAATAVPVVLPRPPDGARFAEVRVAAAACEPLAAGLTAQALERFEAAVAGDASVALRDLACRVAFRCQAWERAERWLAAMLLAAPDNAPAWFNLAIARFQRGGYVGAIEAVRRSLALRPGYPAAERLLADVERRLAGEVGR